MVYHHGDLAAALVQLAVEEIEENGVEALSLRELARRAGVSHGAPAHHFGDKRGVLLAVAQFGYELFYDELLGATSKDDYKVETAVAYVRFAVERPRLFDLMFSNDIIESAGDELLEARARARTILTDLVAGDGHQPRRSKVPLSDRAIASWAIVHGLAELWRSGNLNVNRGVSVDEMTRRVVRHLRLN